MGVGSGGRLPPWIFIHGTDIVEEGLAIFRSSFLLFLGIFSVAPIPPWKRLNSAIFGLFLLFFGLFLLFFGLFSVGHPENFSADALAPFTLKFEPLL